MSTAANKKSLLLPLLVVGGAVAFYFYSKSNTAPVAAAADTGIADGGDVVGIDDGSGTGTIVVQPPPLVSQPPVTLPVVNTVAETERTVLLRDGAAYPSLIVALRKMSSSEILDTYNYFYSYFLYNKKLYRYPDPSAPGQWNTSLYDAVQVLKLKYGIF